MYLRYIVLRLFCLNLTHHTNAAMLCCLFTSLLYSMCRMCPRQLAASINVKSHYSWMDRPCVFCLQQYPAHLCWEIVAIATTSPAALTRKLVVCHTCLEEHGSKHKEYMAATKADLAYQWENFRVWLYHFFNHIPSAPFQPSSTGSSFAIPQAAHSDRDSAVCDTCKQWTSRSDGDLVRRVDRYTLFFLCDARRPRTSYLID